VAPDDSVIQYVAGRAFSPTGRLWEQAVAHWRTLASDEDACFERELEIDCSAVRPQITWGTSPQDLVSIDEPLPDPASAADAERCEAMRRAFVYMDLVPGRPLEGVPVDYAFIGSCTNSRLSDLEAAARVVRGRKVAAGVTALVVPGSMQVKAAAEAAGLDKVFVAAGFEWRNAGCSMCLAMNPDRLEGREICASSSNRNFKGRQGSPTGRTLLMSPAMVAAAAVAGEVVDVREFASPEVGVGR
jgi:3-isopropylmalate/(R)-2-methylmalate dehydratase large subunit